MSRVPPGMSVVAHSTRSERERKLRAHAESVKRDRTLDEVDNLRVARQVQLLPIELLLDAEVQSRRLKHAPAQLVLVGAQPLDDLPHDGLKVLERSLALQRHLLLLGDPVVPDRQHCSSRGDGNESDVLLLVALLGAQVLLGATVDVLDLVMILLRLVDNLRTLVAFVALSGGQPHPRRCVSLCSRRASERSSGR